MPLPGLSLPGLVSSGTPVPSSNSAPPVKVRLQDLSAQTEWRFEAAIGQIYNVRLVSGLAENFGVELVANRSYDFSGQKGAILTWQGCQLEITGDAESEYVAQETEYGIEWLNVYGMLETARQDNAQDGPRVLVVGPDHSGKSSLVRSLTAWGCKTGSMPTVVNLDPREGMLAPPSALTAITAGHQMDVETGYGISGISGPTVTPVKTPVVYAFPFASPMDQPGYYKSILTRMALSVTNKLEEDPMIKRSGILMDTPGSLNDPKSNYDLIMHIVSEFSITLVLSLGSERLYNDLNRRLSTSAPAGFSTNQDNDEVIPVLRITKPGGATERDTNFMRAIRVRQVRSYFFGGGENAEQLNPHSHSVNFADLTVFKAKTVADIQEATDRADNSDDGNGNDDDDDDDDVPYAAPRMGRKKALRASAAALFDKVTPGNAMTGALLAIKFCVSNSDEAMIRDSAVMGYLYVADVDETRKRVRFLSPHPQRWGNRALVWGPWPEAVSDLVS